MCRRVMVLTEAFSYQVKQDLVPLRLHACKTFPLLY
jgi:hypothetical protein